MFEFEMFILEEEWCFFPVEGQILMARRQLFKSILKKNTFKS